jgi:hypothetical protein
MDCLEQHANIALCQHLGSLVTEMLPISHTIQFLPLFMTKGLDKGCYFKNAVKVQMASEIALPEVMGGGFHKLFKCS